MQLTVLGCRAGMPADGQGSSGYLVTTGTTKLLLDCGPGIATALSAVTDPSELDAVVISHFHSDHCYDLLPIGKSLISKIAHAVGPHPDEAALEGFAATPLYVPKGSGTLFERWAGLFPVSTYPLLDKAFEVAFDIREYEPGQQCTIGDCDISLHETRHVMPNCGIRIEAPGATFAYTGDTGMTPALDDLAASADILLAEASLAEPDPGPHGHLCGNEAGVVAAKAGVAQLVLTHFPSAEPAVLEATRAAAAEAFDGPIHLATPGAIYKV